MKLLGVAVLMLSASTVVDGAPLNTPPLGLNTWYSFGMAASFEHTTERNVLATAQFMLDSGLTAAGYNYLVVDDGWSAGSRTHNGELMANATKFPSGMLHVATQVRARGLRLGLYTTPGEYSCSGESGGGERASKGHEAQDVAMWVGLWGVQWVKNCVCNATLDDRRHPYADMRAALDALPGSDRGNTTILECANYMDAPWSAQGVFPQNGTAQAAACDVYTVKIAHYGAQNNAFGALNSTFAGLRRRAGRLRRMERWCRSRRAPARARRRRAWRALAFV